jgi:hypothetical protein
MRELRKLNFFAAVSGLIAAIVLGNMIPEAGVLPLLPACLIWSFGLSYLLSGVLARLYVFLLRLIELGRELGKSLSRLVCPADQLKTEEDAQTSADDPKELGP